MTSPDWRGLRGDPGLSDRFLFEVDGVEIGVFSEVSGLEVSVAVEEYQEGGENGFAHKLPGRMSWPHVVLKRGLCDSDALFEWMQKTSGEGYAAGGNKLARSTGAVTVVDSAGTRLRSWNLQAVFPVKWSGPTFSASQVSALEEQLEIAHHGFTVRAP